ncbi:hypothetical protein [Tropicimonas sp.]|uniref:hypothetical protein n=1 Tax=Tropicimonas sp. TaxID=2067044 RepID=UPI003A88D848
MKRAVRDVAIIDNLIAEVKGNLARGYAIDREAYADVDLDFCFGGYGYRSPGIGWRFCPTPSTSYVTRPVAIDPVVEQRKLRELQQARTKALPQAKQQLAQCDAQFPPVPAAATQPAGR